MTSRSGIAKKVSDIEGLYGYFLSRVISSFQFQTPAAAIRPLSVTGVLEIIKWRRLHTLCALQ